MNAPDHPLVPVSFGELADKITILAIKCDRIRDADKLANVRREYSLLHDQWVQLAPPDPQGFLEIFLQLRSVNQTLWDVEDRLREHEHRGEFDTEFVRLARLVYRTNDERARLKRQINELCGSLLMEEKQHPSYA